MTADNETALLTAPRAEKHTRLIVTRRSDDYHVHLEGRLDVWGCGKTEDEAFGDWLRTHRSRLGVEIVEA